MTENAVNTPLVNKDNAMVATFSEVTATIRPAVVFPLVTIVALAVSLDTGRQNLSVFYTIGLSVFPAFQNFARSTTGGLHARYGWSA